MTMTVSSTSSHASTPDLFNIDANPVEASMITETISAIQTDPIVPVASNDDQNVRLRKTSTVIERRPTLKMVRKTTTQDSIRTIRTNIPFKASRHSQIVPIDEDIVTSDEILPRMVNCRHKGSNKFIVLPNAVEDNNTDGTKTRIIDSSNNIGNPKIGRTISRGHENFQIVYNMLTGIQSAILHSENDLSDLTPQDFKTNKKFVFQSSESDTTPKYSFKFKDYSPKVFKKLRSSFKLNDKDYLQSLTSKYVLNEINSPGKSGSFFYYSRDYKYIIKTIHHSEHLHLRKTLREYFQHIVSNPNTLICQFYGLYRIKFHKDDQTFNLGNNKQIYFLVMNNLFPPNLQMNITFDLKGSTWGRLTSQSMSPKPTNSTPTTSLVMKDLNWLNENEKINFGSRENEVFLKQLKKDVDLLKRLNTMDYSLLVGIHYLDDSESIQDNNTTNNADERLTLGLSTSLISGREKPKKRFVICYVGIIDCLTDYSMVKKLETIWRCMNHDFHSISAVPPKYYGKRFYKFIEKSIVEN